MPEHIPSQMFDYRHMDADLRALLTDATVNFVAFGVGGVYLAVFLHAYVWQ